MEVLFMETRLSGGGICTRGRGPPFSFCMGCYTNLRKRTNHKAHRGYSARSKPYIPYLGHNMKRPTCQATPPKKGQWYCPDAPFRELYPTIAAGLCDCWWDDGKPRDPWTLGIAMGDEGVRLTLTDRTQAQSAYTMAATLTEGLQLLEEALAGDLVTWRRWKKK